jgi:ring-1,2-phenylacetyl-CoA epoxidase subunit PaaC
LTGSIDIRAAGPRLEYVLRLADSPLVLGQRLGEWCGRGPALEEEMALVNFALDLVGQARMLLVYAAELEDADHSEDDLAFLRDSMDFRNLLLAELPNRDFAFTIARQCLFDLYQCGLYEGLQHSSDERLAQIAAKAAKESRYHLRHSAGWLVRLGDGTAESHQRAQAALDDIWRYTGEMFESDEVEQALVAEGIAPDPAALHEGWQSQVDAILREATLARPEDEWMASGGRQGNHTEHLGYMLAEMQFLQRAYPGASW